MRIDEVDRKDGSVLRQYLAKEMSDLDKTLQELHYRRSLFRSLLKTYGTQDVSKKESTGFHQ